MVPVSSNGSITRGTRCFSFSLISSFIQRIVTRRTELPVTNSPDDRFQLPVLTSQRIVLMHIYKHEDDGICRCPGFMESRSSFTIPDTTSSRQDIEKWCTEVNKYNRVARGV